MYLSTPLQPLPNINSAGVVLTSINNENSFGKVFTFNDFNFIRVLDNTSNSGVDGDTVLTLRALPNSNFRGTLDVRYRRINIAELDIDTSLFVGVSDIVTTTDLLPTINTTYNLMLESADIINEPLVANDLGYCTLTISESSYLYYGAVEFFIPTNLSNIITITTLSGLNYPA
jgi:hypothetical protein